MPERDETPGGDMIVGGDATGFANNMNDNSTNLASTIRGLKKFDGRNPAEFKGWMKKLCVVLGAQRKDMFPLQRAIHGLQARTPWPTPSTPALLIQEHEHDNEISGDGQSAFETLCENYNKVTDEVIR